VAEVVAVLAKTFLLVAVEPEAVEMLVSMRPALTEAQIPEGVAALEVVEHRITEEMVVPV
jgi:hypothetical protein